MHLLKTFNTPTDIFVIGSWFGGDVTETFSITDDYASYTIRGMNKSGKTKDIGMESDGFVYVMSADEFVKNYEKIANAGGGDADEDQEVGMIHNFVGDVNLLGLVDDKDFFGDDYDPSQYAWHQNCCEDETPEVVVDFGVYNPETITLGELFKMVPVLKRDQNIDEILS